MLRHVAVVGSGPAGMYSVEHLLRTLGDQVRVTIVERLPVPFGLVRYGVAPDHPEVKNVTHKFAQLAADPRVRFAGNVALTSTAATTTATTTTTPPPPPRTASVSLGELRACYDAVICAYGAQRDRLLHIPGESLPGVLGARAFVEWYNALPDAGEPPIDMAAALRQCRRAVVIGQGNVAVDVSRVLAHTPVALQSTDIAARAIEALSASSVQHVTMVGRRGLFQAAFSMAELRELTKLERGRVRLRRSDVDTALVFEQAAAGGAPEPLQQRRRRERLLQLLEPCVVEDARWTEECQRLYQAGNVVIELAFQLQPKRILEANGGGGPSRVAGVEFERTALTHDPQSKDCVAAGTGQLVTVEADLVLRSIGYQSVPVPGLPFDNRRHVIVNEAGRVSNTPGVYVAGWLKRGPSGVIGTNRDDAEETVTSCAADFEAAATNGAPSSATGYDCLMSLLKSRVSSVWV